jgi:O-antigen biosynthesis alpha-1,3-rhamnosyltransferase
VATLRVAVQAWLNWRQPSGARTRLRGLLTAWADLPESREVEVHLLGSEDPDPVLVTLCAQHSHLHWHAVFPRSRGSLARTLDESRRLAPALRALDVDLLDIGSLPLPRLATPMCLTLHDLRDLGPHARGLRRFAIHQALEHAVHRAGRIVVPSAAVALQLQERHPRATGLIRVVPPAFDAGPFRGAKPLSGLEPPYFLHLGRPEPRKNLPFLIRAYQAARSLDADLPPLVLAGPSLEPRGRPRALVRALAEGDGGVRFVDNPTDEQLPSLLAGACALVFPSVLEGFGMPALEALAAGLPILAPVGSVQAQVAGAAAWPLPLEEPLAWTRALLRIAHSPALRSKLHEAAQLRAQEYSPAAAARAWLRAWRETSLAGSAHAFETGA